MDSWEEKEKKVSKLIKLGIYGVVVIIASTLLLFKTFEVIPNGTVGVQYSRDGVEEETLRPGIRWVGIKRTIIYPIKRQTVQYKSIPMATKDGLPTTVPITIDYKVDPKSVVNVYKEFGSITTDEIEENWLRSELQKSTRQATGKVTILEAAGEGAGLVQDDILQDFQKRVAKKGFLVDGITFSVPVLDKGTKKSINDNVQAGQENEKEKIIAEKKATAARGVAEADRIKAEGQAKVKEINAQADAKAKETSSKAEADANKRLAESMNGNILEHEKNQAYQKHGFPTVVNGSAIVDTRGDK